MPRLHRRAAAPLVTALTAVALVASAGTAGADELPMSATDQRVHDSLTSRSLARELGPDLAGLVMDAATGTALWSKTPREAQTPASNVKILTAVTALETFGPDHRFTTRVMSGVTKRRLVLVGSGDPSFTHQQVRDLARTAAAGIRAQGLRRVRVEVDDSLFPAPTMTYGWKASYQLSSVSPVRALVVDQHRNWDTALDAGRAFARKLERFGLRVASVKRRVRPPDSRMLAESQGEDLAGQVATMLAYSDNDIAEGLHRLVAAETGYATTWAGARAAQTAALGRLGITLARSSYDGSGLSRSDRLSATELVTALAAIADGTHPSLASLQHGSLAVAGVSGTLGPRYLRYVTRPTRCAIGLVEAKTGSLQGVISLSGFARGADGQVKLFSFLLNRVPSTLATRRAVDKLAATVTGCW